jgi:hypothetical protein
MTKLSRATNPQSASTPVAIGTHPEDILKLREKFNGMANDYESAPTAWVWAVTLRPHPESATRRQSGGEVRRHCTAWFEATKT